MKKLFGLYALMFSSTVFGSDLRVLAIGEEMRLPGMSRVWLGSPKILSARAEGSGVRLKGKAEGIGEVRHGEKSFQVRVVNPRSLRTARSLTSALKTAVGLEQAWSDSVVTVTGRLHDLKDYLRLVENLPEDAQWEMRAEIPDRLRVALETELSRRLGASAPVRPLLYEENISALFKGGKDESATWTRRLARWGIALRRDDSAIDVAPVIRVEITVAEVRKDRQRLLGVKWPAAQGTLLPNGVLVGDNMAFSAEAFEKEGMGRILARPNLLCRSGKEAEFMAGGEFPIKIAHHKSQEVVWKRYGILLKIKPLADASGRISLAMETEISTIDIASAVEGIPGLLTNRVSSHFDLSRPRTIVLSGLIKSEDSKNHEGLLGLSSLPILGTLFGSKSWRENRTELVIFVTPRIVKEEI